ncbi:Uncharacterised protein [Mycoplasmopsis maculosa]|uniref:Lipoprotein n=1 Tax=Mycoplasmopsis maculosa TaxID=114885 RepID=A0A449B4W2_9BACT|nr:hypothetical protein [Mycoplasmopsis maculosa]VEU75609.1 Uncharacterised protein [Mycoplasmopsis maculosa]
MKKNKIINTFSLISPIAAFTALSCGQIIETPEKIKQDKNFSDSSNVKKVENIWKTIVLSDIYNLNVNYENNAIGFVNLDQEFVKTFNDSSSNLFRDSYEAFKFYANNKIKEDQYYFTNKINEWNKNNVLGKNVINILDPAIVPTADQFKILWNSYETEIREKIQNMLLVKAYFAINDKSKIEKIFKEVNNETFKYASGTEYAKYSLENYFLVKYALEQKFVQLWKRNDTSAFGSDSYFIQGSKEISNIENFNEYFEKASDKDNKLQEWEVITSNGDSEKQLSGYSGFQKDPGSYGLQWNYEELKNSLNDDLYHGVFDPNNGTRLITLDRLATTAVSPYVAKNGNDSEIIVAYINQIVPIGGNDKIMLPKSEFYDKEVSTLKDNEKEEVTVLSFKNTIYKDKLNEISYMFYFKDSTLLDTAINSFAAQGIKIKINEELKPLYDLLKDKSWVQK